MTPFDRDAPASPPLVAVLAIVMLVAACGGPGDASQAAGPPSGAESPGGDEPKGGDDVGGQRAADGPVRLTLDGTTHGYTVGRCEIIDDVVYVTAMTDDATGQFEATLPPWDREIAHAQRDGSVKATMSGADGPGFDLAASRHQPGTTWDWTVSGSDVDLTVVMGDRSSSGESPLTRPEVTVEIECHGGQFGSGPYAASFEQEFFPIEPGSQRVPGGITIELDGTEYAIPFLVHCEIFAQSVTAEGTSDDASVYLYSEGAGVNLDLLIGDRRAEEDGTRWSLPGDAEHMDDFLLTGDATSRAWSGSLVSEDGQEAEATITVECTEGDGFASAGMGTIVLDGTAHELDEVSTCDVDGSAVDFFGSSTTTDVALVVTAGGSQVLVGDETGAQSATFDVEFDVVGQGATWSGTLAAGQRATIQIDCG